MAACYFQTEEVTKGSHNLCCMDPLYLSKDLYFKWVPELQLWPVSHKELTRISPKSIEPLFPSKSKRYAYFRSHALNLAADHSCISPRLASGMAWQFLAEKIPCEPSRQGRWVKAMKPAGKLNTWREHLRAPLLMRVTPAYREAGIWVVGGTTWSGIVQGCSWRAGKDPVLWVMDLCPGMLAFSIPPVLSQPSIWAVNHDGTDKRSTPGPAGRGPWEAYIRVLCLGAVTCTSVGLGSLGRSRLTRIFQQLLHLPSLTHNTKQVTHVLSSLGGVINVRFWNL